MPLPCWPLPAPWIHALLMIFGFFPFFIFGFVMTAGPRWQAAAPVGQASYLGGLCPDGRRLAGLLCGDVAAATAAAGAGAGAGGLVRGLPALWRVARTPSNEQTHIVAVVGGTDFRGLLLAAFLAFAAGGPAWLAQLAVKGAPVVLPAAGVHGAVPSHAAVLLQRRDPELPRRAALVGAACCCWPATPSMACSTWPGCRNGPGSPTCPRRWRPCGCRVAWQLRRCLAVRLLAVLHIAFAWLGVGLALHAAHSLLLF